MRSRIVERLLLGRQECVERRFGLAVDRRQLPAQSPGCRGYLRDFRRIIRLDRGPQRRAVRLQAGLNRFAAVIAAV